MYGKTWQGLIIRQAERDHRSDLSSWQAWSSMKTCQVCCVWCLTGGLIVVYAQYGVL